MLLTQLGSMCGWTSPYLARLTVPGSTIFLTLDEASWVAALLNVGRFAGAFVGAICVHFWGSKRAVMHTLMPMTLSWILILVADRPLMLYLARLAGGLGLGMAFSCFPLYIGEVALPEIRGAIITLAFCGSPFGNVASSIAGYYLSANMSGIVFLVPCLLDIALFMWLPDSPHHLVKVGKLEEARSAIEWYRNGVKVDEEFEAVQKFITASGGKSLKEKADEFRAPPVKRALFIVIMLFIFMQICGLNSILFYMEIIFRRGKSTLIDPSLAVILVNVSGAITAVLSVNMMDKCGRKILLMVSGLGITLSMVALGTHFLLMDLGYNPEDFQWLPVASTFLFMISFVFGLMPVPSAVLSEIFPSSIKSIGAFLASFTGAVFAFGATKSYQPMIDAIGEAYVFYLHAVCTATVVPLVLFFMPETKGKTLHEIQELLVKKS